MSGPNLPSLPGLPGVPQIPGGLGTTDIQQIAVSYGVPNTSLQDPNMLAALGSVQQQASIEGAGGLEQAARVRTLFEQFNGVYQNGRFDATAAIQAARKYVGTNHEVQGAIDLATGLVSAMQNVASGQESPVDMVASFTGPLVSAAVLAGSISAGVGAAIVGGIALVAGFIDSLSAPKPGVQICNGFNYTGGGQVSWSIGCVAVLDPTNTPIAPGTPAWRSFPNQQNNADKWWFISTMAVVHGVASPFYDWKGARYIPKMDSGAATVDWKTALQIAFPMWTYVYASGYDMVSGKVLTAKNVIWPNLLRAQGVLPWTGRGAAPAALEQEKAFWDFTAAFTAAWKANAEYALNGLKMQDDTDVLVRMVQVWNRAHEPGVGLDVGTQPRGFGWENRDEHKTGTIAEATGAIYWTTLIAALLHKGSGDPDVQLINNKLRIHTGPAKKFGVQAATIRVPGTILKGLHFAGLPAKPQIVATVITPPPLAKRWEWAALGWWQRLQPWAPLGAGAVAFPFLGALAPVIGAAGTALMLYEEHKRKGSGR